MDTKKQSPLLNNSAIIQHQAHLFIGNAYQEAQNTVKRLQDIFCAQDGCRTCSSCMAINEKNFEDLLWLCPEKQYTRDQLTALFQATSFVLEPSQHFFIVLERADYLNQACANSLLKLLEEPPVGYHFILLAQQAELVLPTIRSRCIIHYSSNEQNQEQHVFFKWFTTLKFPSPAAALAVIEKESPDEYQSITLAENILLFWFDYHKQVLTDQKKAKRALWCINYLQKTIEEPPMPGSSKIFWKNIYLHFLSNFN